MNAPWASSFFNVLVSRHQYPSPGKGVHYGGFRRSCPGSLPGPLEPQVRVADKYGPVALLHMFHLGPSLCDATSAH